MNRREAIQRTAMMLGYAVSAPAIMGVLNGCKAKPQLAFKPIFFNEDQAASVEALAEIILPKTNTPGAKDVGVPGFIDQILGTVYEKELQDKFLKGLAELDEDAKKNYGSNFAVCEPSEQVELFKKHHDAAFQTALQAPSLGWWNPRPAGERPFVIQLKELVLLGFFTSKIGASDVLQYNEVPGPFKGCVPLKEVGKTWAT